MSKSKATVFNKPVIADEYRDALLVKLLIWII